MLEFEPVRLTLLSSYVGVDVWPSSVRVEMYDPYTRNTPRVHLSPSEAETMARALQGAAEFVRDTERSRVVADIEKAVHGKSLDSLLRLRRALEMGEY